MKLCSLDVRSGGQSRPPPWSGGGKVGLARPARLNRHRASSRVESRKKISEAAWNGLLCSRNARPQKTLVGHAEW
jgi:hypothetical protein